MDDDADDAVTGGEGQRGNGQCPITTECCSQYGTPSILPIPTASNSSLLPSSLSSPVDDDDDVDMENVNPQQLQREQSSLSLSKSSSLTFAKASSTTVTTTNAATLIKAAAPLSFEEFKQLRRQSSRSTNYVPPMLPLERSGNSRHLIRGGDARVGKESSRLMSFDEFKEVRRASLNGKVDNKVQLVNDKQKSTMRLSTQEKKSFRKSSSRQKVKQYGTTPLVPKKVLPKTVLLPAAVLPKLNTALTPIKEDGQHYPSKGQHHSSLLLLSKQNKASLLSRSSGSSRLLSMSSGSSSSKISSKSGSGRRCSNLNASTSSSSDKSNDPMMAHVKDVFANDTYALKASEALATYTTKDNAVGESYIITTTTQHHDNDIHPSMSTLTEDDVMLLPANPPRDTHHNGSPPTKSLVKTIDKAIADTSLILDEALEDTIEVIGEAQHLLTVTATQSIIANEMEYEEDYEGVLLPEGMPELLVIPTDWEELAGFIGGVGEEDVGIKNRNEKKKGTRSSSIGHRSTLDTSDILPIHSAVDKVDDDTTAVPETIAQDETDRRRVYEDDDDDDPRNHSMWVVVPDNEDMTEDEDDVNNIVIGTLLEEEEEVEGHIAFESSNNDVVVNENEKLNNEPLSPVWDPSPFSFNKGNVTERSSSFLDSLEGALKEESVKKLGIDVRHSIDAAILPGNEFQAVASGAAAVTSLLHGEKPQDASADAKRAGNDTSKKRREPKGRILLIRIKKKVSKVPKAMKKMLLLPFGHKSRKNHDGDGAEDEDIVTEVKLLISPRCNSAAIGGEPLVSPSCMSVISITSSIVTSNTNNNGTASTAIIGAVPVKSGIPPSAAGTNSLLYGAINYDGSRSCNAEEDSTVGGDELPPPPTPSMFLPALARSASLDEEDAVSFLAEAMRCAQSSDDDEYSVILVVAPKEDSVIGSDDSTCLVASSAVDAQSPMLSTYDSVQSKDHAEEAEDDISYLEAMPPQQDLACLFHDDDSTLQIMEAVAVDGGYLLTPTGGDSLNNDRANIFRCSISEAGGNILPGSSIGSDDDDEEDEDLLFHDGCTAIQQTLTFDDHTLDPTIATKMTSSNTQSHNLSVDVSTSEEALLPSTSTPSSQHVNIDSINSLLQRFDQLRLSSNASSSPLICNSSKSATVTNTSSTQNKKSPPKDCGRNSRKQSPKSASKTRSIGSRRGGGGLVKSRISDIQQRIEVASSASASDDDTSLYRGPSHRLSSSNNFIRTVPIGIAKSYSRDSDSHCGDDSIDGSEDGASNRNSIGLSDLSHYADNDRFERNLNSGYAQKYTKTLDMM